MDTSGGGASSSFLNVGPAVRRKENPHLVRTRSTNQNQKNAGLSGRATGRTMQDRARWPSNFGYDYLGNTEGAQLDDGDRACARGAESTEDSTSTSLFNAGGLFGPACHKRHMDAEITHEVLSEVYYPKGGGPPPPPPADAAADTGDGSRKKTKKMQKKEERQAKRETASARPKNSQIDVFRSWRSTLNWDRTLCVSGFGSKYALLHNFGNAVAEHALKVDEIEAELVYKPASGDGAGGGSTQTNDDSASRKINTRVARHISVSRELNEEDIDHEFPDGGMQSFASTDDDELFYEEGGSCSSTSPFSSTESTASPMRGRDFDYVIHCAAALGMQTDFAKVMEQAWLEAAKQFLDDVAEAAGEGTDNDFEEFMRLLKGRTTTSTATGSIRDHTPVGKIDEIKEMLRAARWDAGFDLRMLKRGWNATEYEYTDCSRKRDCFAFLLEELMPILSDTVPPSKTVRAPLSTLCRFWRRFAELAEIKVLLVVHGYDKLHSPQMATALTHLVGPSEREIKLANIERSTSSSSSTSATTPPGMIVTSSSSTSALSRTATSSSYNKNSIDDINMDHLAPRPRTATRAYKDSEPPLDGCVRLLLGLDAVGDSPFSTRDEGALRIEHVVHHSYLPYTNEVPPSQVEYFENVLRKHGMTGNKNSKGATDNFFGKCRSASRAFTAHHVAILRCILEAHRTHEHGISYQKLDKEMMSTRGIGKSPLETMIRELKDQEILYEHNPSDIGRHLRLACSLEYVKTNFESLKEIFEVPKGK
ncbi:unnamed protein product [Amoebophrya sp. A25]|nr:unnamed protein product [Amoebophrya sp. A25]|eukprot:GSA25T00003919001.1